MKRNALLTGSFVLAGLALIVAGVLWLGGRSLFSQRVEAGIYYRGAVTGLVVGAPVTFRGVPVGQVKAIGIEVDSRTLHALIAVVVQIQTGAVRLSDQGSATAEKLDIPGLVQRGLRARLVAQSVVTGQKTIELDFLPQTPVTLYSRGPRPEIPGLGDRFGALADQVAELPLRDTVAEVRAVVNEMRLTLQSTQRAIDGLQVVLAGAATEVNGIGTEARRTLAVAGGAVRQVQVSAVGTLDAVTRLSESSRRTIEGTQPELQRTLSGAREASESARLAMDRVAELTAPGAALRGDLDAAVRDLSQAARGLRDWSELLEEKPNAVIFGNRRE